MNEYGIGCTDAGLADPTPGEDLSSYVGHGAYFDGTAWQVASLTDAFVTAQLGRDEHVGVIVQGAETSEKLELAYPSLGGFIEAKAGTGGVTDGDWIVCEYAASGTDRGRFITASIIQPGQFIWGKARSTAAEDALFTLDLGLCFQATSAHAVAPTAIATAGDHTLTADQLFSVEIARDPSGGNRTDTSDTAANIILAMTARGLTANGSSFRAKLTNTADAAESITLAAGSGVTATGTGSDLVVSQNESAVLEFSKVSATVVSMIVIKD